MKDVEIPDTFERCEMLGVPEDLQSRLLMYALEHGVSIDFGSRDRNIITLKVNGRGYNPNSDKMIFQAMVNFVQFKLGVEVVFY